MAEALEPVSFNLFTPPELSAYSEDDLLGMFASILSAPGEPTLLDRACMEAINTELFIRDARTRYAN
jgi:hypothetical protein